MRHDSFAFGGTLGVCFRPPPDPTPSSRQNWGREDLSHSMGFGGLWRRGAKKGRRTDPKTPLQVPPECKREESHRGRQVPPECMHRGSFFQSSRVSNIDASYRLVVALQWGLLKGVVGEPPLPRMRWLDSNTTAACSLGLGERGGAGF